MNQAGGCRLTNRSSRISPSSFSARFFFLLLCLSFRATAAAEPGIFRTPGARSIFTTVNLQVMAAAQLLVTKPSTSEPRTRDFFSYFVHRAIPLPFARTLARSNVSSDWLRLEL
ncbi:uncharacterized protein BDV14DRAFT_162047 [Aspergillus stella-maris]|uniref:uncharacterized protein n=1 Tax=Aspergillus stella-maris TaxID=1810926 RepID=UPI003CCD50A8